METGLRLKTVMCLERPLETLNKNLCFGVKLCFRAYMLCQLLFCSQ